MKKQYDYQRKLIKNLVPEFLFDIHLFFPWVVSAVQSISAVYFQYLLQKIMRLSFSKTGKGIAKIDPIVFDKLKLLAGDTLKIDGTKSAIVYAVWKPRFYRGAVANLADALETEWRWVWHAFHSRKQTTSSKFREKLFT